MCDDTFWFWYFVGYVLFMAVIAILAAVYFIGDFIYDVKNKKDEELRDKINFNGDWIYYDRDKKGFLFDTRIERKKREEKQKKLLEKQKKKLKFKKSK